MTLAMKMEARNQLHIDWGRNRDWLLVGTKTQYELRGGSKGVAKGDPVLATDDQWGHPWAKDRAQSLQSESKWGASMVPKHQGMTSIWPSSYKSAVPGALKSPSSGVMW